ncbi:MAG: zinc-dependent alcohol dehydrogenase family protein [Steroidobacteraceae bacterium]|nr:zinc-dependent alcohol dehydrogenase family protein [Steroidobacteraceae bacterium]MDW8258502.1 zinc-dependent alcohol dehydrogenase family protein [Gammaproteobacteria bacterium]
MRAARHFVYGSPAEVLRVVDVPPEEPAADEVIVRMEAAALHLADLRALSGLPGFQYPLPRTPGFEGIGHVARVGRAVTTWRVGDRVFPPLGSGTCRDEVRCKAAQCLPAPPGDAVQLSLVVVNGATAQVLLDDFGDLRTGDWFIQNAANSSCGRYLIRLAARKGVRSVNIVRRPELLDELRELGGDVVLEDGADLAARVAHAVHGAPIKVAFDAVGGAATQRLAECLTPGSTVVSYGAMSGQPCHLDFYLMFRNDIRLQGVSFVRQLQRRSADQVRQMYARLAELVATGELVARVAGVYELEDIVTAFERAAQTGADRDGKVIVRLRSSTR